MCGVLQTRWFYSVKASRDHSGTDESMLAEKLMFSTSHGSSCIILQPLLISYFIPSPNTYTKQRFQRRKKSSKAENSQLKASSRTRNK